MKKVILSLAAIIVLGSMAMAQNKNVNKAKRLYDAGEIAEALPLIEEAIVHEKTMEKGKTWYTYAEILQAILRSEDEAINSLKENALEEAVNALNKTMEYEKEGTTYYTFSEIKLQELYGTEVNQGVQSFQDKDFESAINYFERALVVNPKDTSATLYAGVAAQSNQQNDVALKFYYRLIELDYHDEEIYNSIIAIERYDNKDDEKALEVVRTAMEHLPENKNFPKIEIQLLIELKIIDEAMEKLKADIERDPNNEVLMFTQGLLYEGLGESDKMIASYEKALEIKPDYLEALFNMGVHYFNIGVEYNKEYNNMNIQEARKRGKEVKDNALKYFKLALPYFEKAREVAPDEMAVLTTLRDIYGQLRMEDEFEEIIEVIDAKEAEGGN